MAKNPHDLLPEIQALIAEGRLIQAKEALKATARLKIPRELCIGFAKVARQAGVPQVGLRFLNDIVHPPKPLKSDATASENAEFAMGLVRIGAVEEAADLMAGRLEATTKDVLLAKIFVLAPRWEYSQIIEVAQLYLGTEGLNPTERIIGQLNLGAAYLQESKISAAMPILQKVLQEAETNKLPRFVGNALELGAQCAIREGKWEVAENFLNRADAHLKGTGSLDELFLRKWRSVLELKKRANHENREKLSLVRLEAEKKKHWETVRDCDFWLGTILQDAKLLEHVYFGTPLESYRRYLLRENPKFRPPEIYHRVLGAALTKRIATLDTNSGEWDGREVSLRPGGALHRLFFALASDFYRPRRLPSLHYHVYPDEFFNPVSAPLRVHQILFRLRDWVKEHRIPLQVIEIDNAYWLKSKSALQLEYRLEQGVVTESDSLVSKLKQHPKPLSANEIGALMAMAPRSTRRLLQTLVNEGKVLRLGLGKTSRYCLPVAEIELRRAA